MESMGESVLRGSIPIPQRAFGVIECPPGWWHVGGGSGRTRCFIAWRRGGVECLQRSARLVRAEADDM